MTTPSDDRARRAAELGVSKRHQRRWRFLWAVPSRQLFDPDQWQLGLARWCRRAGRATTAEKLYQRLVARQPNNFPVLAELGRLLLRERRYAEAVGIWQQAAAIRPRARDAAFQFARALHRSGRLEQAEVQYRYVLTLDPSQDKALAALDQLGRQTRLAHVQGLLEAGNIAEAETQLKAMLAVFPREPDALTLLARIRSRNDPEEAFSYWSQVADVKPRAVEPPLQMARIRARQQRMVEAGQWFEAVLKREPDHAEALAGIGHALAESDRSAAIRHFTQWAERQPDSVAPRLELARLHQRAHEWDRAEAIYREVLERDPQNPQALARFAELLSRAASDMARPNGASGVEPMLRSARAAYNRGRLADAAQVLARALRIDAVNPKVLSLLSRLYLREQKWTDAVALLTRLDAAQPGDARIKGMLGEALLRSGQYAAAARAYEELAALAPGDWQVLERLASVYSRARRWKAACQIYARLVEHDPAQKRTRLAYAQALRETGNIAEVETQLKAVLAVFPREPDALTLLARICSRNDPEEAFTYWSRLADMKPRAVEPLLQMARIRARQQRMVEAGQWFEAVLKREPDHAEALAGIGHALAESDRSAAIRHFTQWAERQPDSVAPRLELARLHQRAHEWDRAEAIYREVLERDPQNPQALARFAELLSRDHTRFDHALQLWRQISERDPTAAFPIVQLALLYERVRRSDEAETEYRRATTCAPGDIAATMGLARLLSSGGRWAEAAELFGAVHRAHPDRADAPLAFGRCLERLGRDEEALSAYRQVLALQPTNANAPLYRGRLLRRLGRTDEAIEQWQRICERSQENIDAWCELIFLLASAEREAEALAALDAAEAALPASTQSWSRLALAAEAAQLHDRAVGYFEQTIAAAPNDAGHHAQFGNYYLRQGLVDAAFRYLLLSRELKPTQLSVARQLVDTVHILNDLGIDHVSLHRAPPTTGEVLVPEGLFRLVRRLVDTEVEPYEPVPRRIIAVTASLAAGGAERQLVTMLRGLTEPRFGLDLALFCVSLDARARRDFFLPLLADAPVEVVALGEDAGRCAHNDPENLRFARLIGHFPEDMVGPISFWLAEFRRRRPQVVHAWQDATNLTAVVAALLAGVPRIILCARSVRPDNPRRRLKRFMKEAYQAVLGHPSVLLSNNSRAGANDYADWLGLDPAAIEVVYNGIDFAQLEHSVDPAETRRARDELAIPPDAPVLGSAFRMSEEKRPLLWVEAAAAVARESPNAHFIVCGDGPMRAEMSDLAARLGVADRLHLPGPQRNIASWYKAMDVVMLTSRHEGLPNVLLEAQSLGVPVVAPDVGGMSEAVWQGVTGWTVQGADAASLADRVLYCLGAETWMARARAEAPGFVKNRFSTTSMLHRTLEVYGMTPMAVAATES